MRYNFNQAPTRRGTDSEKWHKYGPEVIPLWVADMDFVSPQPVIEALLKRADHGIFGYPKQADELRLVITGHLAKHYHWQVDPEAVIFLPGVVTSFNLACHASANNTRK